MTARCFTMLLLLAACTGGFGQGFIERANELKFRHIGTAQGLSNSSGTAISQDCGGFIWIGTRNGLNRYDGINMTVFQRDDADSTSISHNRIETIYVSSVGQIWVGTDDGLNLYRPGAGFRKFFADPHDERTLPHSTVFSIVERSDGQLWVGTRGGLALFDPATGKARRYRHDPARPGSLSDNYVKAVETDEQGNLWVVTLRGVDLLPQGAEDFRHYGRTDVDLKEASIPARNDVLEDADGDIWVGQYDGLYRLNRSTDRFERWVLDEDPKLSEVQVREIIQDESGTIWVGTYAGLYLIDPRAERTVRLAHSERQPYSLSQNSIYAIFQDQAENFWVGTYSGSINYLDRAYDSFSHYGTGAGLSYHVVSSFTEAGGGNFWVGTEGGGLNHFDRARGTFTAYTQADGLADDNVQDVIRRKDGTLAVATYGGGISLFDPQTDRFTTVSSASGAVNALPSDYISTLLEDSRGQLWVGPTVRGLALLQEDGKSFRRFSRAGKLDFATPIIYEDKQQRIWAGAGNSFCLVDPVAGTVDPEAVGEMNEEINSLVISIHQDENMDFWIGTEGDGLFHLRGNLSEFTNYRTKDGLANNTIFGILPDGAGHLWLSTNAGLSRLNPGDGTFEHFDVENGLQSNEFNYDAAYRSRSGELLFGGVNGFNLFDPVKIRARGYRPPVYITEMRVREEQLSRAPGVGSQDDPLVLTHDQTPFTFGFVSLNFSQPRKDHFAYMLEGHDDDWLDIGNKRHRTFTNIGAGNYVFRVKAGPGAGEYGDHQASFHLRILPPWWRSWWACLLYLAGVLALAGLILRHNRARRADRNALKAEKLEREKIEELNHLKMQFFTNVSHELRTPLTLILGPLDRLLRHRHDMNPEQSAELLVVHRNAQRLLNHVNRLMDFRKEEMGKMKLKAAEGNFLHFLKETSLSFQEVATHRQIEYTFTSDRERIELYYDRDKMEIVLFNLLSNAFKFTPNGGRIAIDVQIVEDDVHDRTSVRFAVRDSGVGIEREDLEHVFDRFYQAQDRAGNERSGSGIGLALTKQLVDLHHGRIEVDSEKGEGSTFSVTLPCGRAHLSADEIIRDFRKSDDATQYDLAAVPTATDGKPSRKDFTLLIVEDNTDIRNFIVSVFEQEYKILTAADGAEGFEAATHHIPDLVISDIMMPETDGITLCAMLKKDLRTSHIPVILLTARTSVIFKRSGLENGADDYITKPFTSNMLLLRVRNLLDARKKMQAYFVRNNKVIPEEITITSQDDVFLQNALKCVEANLDNSQFNVTAFVKEMKMSRSVLYKKLKGLTGQSITEFVRSIRIKRAAQLLLSDRYNISEVAYNVGFSDLKYFRSCFRKQFQMSPSEYIASHKKESSSTVQ